MDPQTADKIIQLLKDGAAAAAGPAKEGLQQVCAFKAQEAMATIVILSIAPVLSALIFALGVWLVEEKEFGIGDLVATFGGFSLAASIIFFMSIFPSTYATMKNPVGATIAELARIK